MTRRERPQKIKAAVQDLGATFALDPRNERALIMKAAFQEYPPQRACEAAPAPAEEATSGNEADYRIADRRMGECLLRSRARDCRPQTDTLYGDCSLYPPFPFVVGASRPLRRTPSSGASSMKTHISFLAALLLSLLASRAPWAARGWRGCGS